MVELTVKEICYWFIKQLYRDRATPNDFLTIRAIHNKPPDFDAATGRKIENDSECTFQRNIPVKDFKWLWFQGGLYEKLVSLNTNTDQPSNIYFGINLRNSSTQNTKKHVIGFYAYYLDLDDNKGYSKEDRAKQIAFWHAIGFPPSIVIDSGHGYHAYWILNRIIPAEEGEPILKRMVAVTGCKVKGNTFDVTRIFRLPCFYNQKYWFEGDKPLCYISQPTLDDINALHNNNDQSILQYAPEVFTAFPPSESVDIAQFVQAANEMDGDFNENLKELVNGAKNELRAQVAHKAANLVNEMNLSAIPTEVENATKKWEPTIDIPPVLLDEIPWPKSDKRWMKSYCKNGFAGQTEKDIQYIVKCTGWDSEQDPSASELDYRVMRALILAGYTYKAIQAFWMRTDLQLYRPEKEAKNQNYLLQTFTNALQAIQNVLEHGAPMNKADKATALQIFNKDGYVLLNDGNKISQIMHGIPSIAAMYENLNAAEPADRTYYQLDVNLPAYGTNGHTQYRTTQMLVNRGAFNSCDRFRRRCHDEIVLLTDKVSDLNRLLLHLKKNARGTTRHKFYGRVCYSDGAFHLPKLVIHADRFEEFSSFDLIKELKDKYPWFDRFACSVAPEHEARDLAKHIWPDVLNLHLPQLVSSMLGLQGITAANSIFRHLGTNISIPCVNIRGASSSGKSLSVQALYRLAMVVCKHPLIGIRTSEFAYIRMAELNEFIPTLLDEFKEEEPNDKHCERVRSLIRRLYTGEQVMRGRADQSLVSYNLLGSIAVLGESHVERAGELANITRLVCVDTDAYKYLINRSTEARYTRVSDAPLQKIGPYFYQFILRQTPALMLQQFKNLREYVDNRLRERMINHEATGRIANNIAALLFGCQLWDSFMLQFSPTSPRLMELLKPADTFIEHASQWSLESGNRLLYERQEEGGKQIVSIQKDELMRFLEELAFIINSKLALVQETVSRGAKFYYYDHEKDELNIDMQLAVHIYHDFSMKGKYLHAAYEKIMQCARAAFAANADFIVAVNANKCIEGRFSKFTVFRFKVLRQMGVWPYPLVNESEIYLEQQHRPALPPPQSTTTDLKQPNTSPPKQIKPPKPQKPDMPPPAMPQDNTFNLID